jgi:small acid-soluble spore protein P (minor)
MGKPKSQPVPGAGGEEHSRKQDQGGQQEPLSGSKKVKQANHTRHNNAEG